MKDQYVVLYCTLTEASALKLLPTHYGLDNMGAFCPRRCFLVPIVSSKFPEFQRKNIYILIIECSAAMIDFVDSEF